MIIALFIACMTINLLFTDIYIIFINIIEFLREKYNPSLKFFIAYNILIIGYNL